MEESEIARVLRKWPEADEGFREELLQRCMSELGKGGDMMPFEMELDDDVLELLAAAGDVHAMPAPDDQA